MLKGTQAVEGALQRAEGLLPNNLSNDAYQASGMDKGWDDQWGNWDDLGGDDPGWGDVKG
jgi:hypothetical protein